MKPYENQAQGSLSEYLAVIHWLERPLGSLGIVDSEP